MKPFRARTKTGFTLIEILIVIAIIAILSTLGLGSYRSTRAAVTLDIEVDRITAQLQKFEADTRSPSLSLGPVCIRVIFDKDQSSIQKLTGTYKNAFDGCNWSDAKSDSISLSSDIGIQNALTVSFTPPSGEMMVDGAEKNITFFLKQNTTVTRKIQFNATTGTIQKNK